MTKQPKRWSTILLDFPVPKQGGEAYYRTETLERLSEFPLANLAADSCHVWCWTTNRYMDWTWRYLESQGFTVRSPLTWVKFRLGFGGPSSLRNATEHVLFATRGRAPVLNRSTPSWFNAPVGAHSEKPSELYKIIARVSPEPRLELFARRQEPGWDIWGDECESTIDPIPNWPVPSDFTKEEDTHQ